MPDLNERINAEASRILQQQEEAARKLRERSQQGEADRTQREFTKKSEQESRISRLTSFLEVLGARDLIQQANREVWDNVGTLHTYVEKDNKRCFAVVLALVSPFYRAPSHHVGGTNTEGGGFDSYDFYTVEDAVEVMMITASEQRDGDHEQELRAQYSDGTMIFRKPSDGEDLTLYSVEGRAKYFATYYGSVADKGTPIQEIRTILESEIITSSANRRLSGRLPKELIANSIREPQGGSIFARAKKAIKG